MLLFHADWKDPHTSRPGHQTTKSKCAHVCVCVFVILVLCVQVYYAKFPPQIDRRQILLLHPVLGRCVPNPLTKLTNTLTQTHSRTISRQSRERRQRRRSQSSRSTESGKRESTSYPCSPHLVVCTHCSENTPASQSSLQRSTGAHPHILASPISAPTDYCTPLLRVCVYTVGAGFLNSNRPMRRYRCRPTRCVNMNSAFLTGRGFGNITSSDISVC